MKKDNELKEMDKDNLIELLEGDEELSSSDIISIIENVGLDFEEVYTEILTDFDYDTKLEIVDMVPVLRAHLIFSLADCETEDIINAINETLPDYFEEDDD